jgi:hypothetical protein
MVGLIANGVERDQFLFLNANSNSHATLSMFSLNMNRYQETEFLG